jgi:hypothetical protein
MSLLSRIGRFMKKQEIVEFAILLGYGYTMRSDPEECLSFASQSYGRVSLFYIGADEVVDLFS